MVLSKKILIVVSILLNASLSLANGMFGSGSAKGLTCLGDNGIVITSPDDRLLVSDDPQELSRVNANSAYGEVTLKAIDLFAQTPMKAAYVNSNGSSIEKVDFHKIYQIRFDLELKSNGSVVALSQMIMCRTPAGTGNTLEQVIEDLN